MTDQAPTPVAPGARTRRTAAALAAALLLSLLPSTAAAQAGDRAGGTTFQGVVCTEDPQGDAADPRVDVVDMCVRHYPSAPDVLLVSIAGAQGFDLEGDAAWENPGSGIAVGFDLDGDDALDRTLELRAEGGTAVARVLDADGDPVSGCDEVVQPNPGRAINAFFSTSCVPGGDGIRTTTTVALEPAPGQAVAVDRVPDDDGAFAYPVPRGDESPVCANATAQVTPLLTTRRVACGGVIAGTEPISQAVATSQFVFDNPATAQIDAYLADWVVLARDDDFADALAGSSLSFGQGPLLFTYSPASTPPGRDPGQLADITRAEILRTLPRGRTVYLLGGEAALAPGLDAELEGLGYDVVRFAGTGREATARLVAGEVSDRVAEFSSPSGFTDVNAVLVANRANWPDAVLAGSVGAFWGMPILLVDAQLPVHPETLAALDELRPDYIHNIGGSSVISTEVAIAIREHATANGYARGRPGEDVTTPGTRWVNFCAAGDEPRYVCRWGGDTRFGTAAAITQLNRDMIGRFAGAPFIPANPQEYAVAINLGGSVDSSNFAYVLSAATVSGRFGGAVFVPTDDQTISAPTRNALCSTPGAERFVEQVRQLVLVGDSDLLADSFADAFRGLVEGGC